MSRANKGNKKRGFPLPSTSKANPPASNSDLIVELIREIDDLKRENQTLQGEQEQKPKDIHQISVFPTLDDMRMSSPDLRPNIVKGAYKDVEDYLDIQFRLFREDFVRPLREGIQEYSLMAKLENRKSRNKTADAKLRKANGVYVHKNVNLQLKGLSDYVCHFNGKRNGWRVSDLRRCYFAIEYSFISFLGKTISAWIAIVFQRSEM